MKSSIDDSRQSLGLFNKDWNVFKSNFTNARRNNIDDPIYNSGKDKKKRYGSQTISLQGGGIKEGIFSIFRSKDLNGLKEYNRLVESGISPMKAYKEAIIGCSEEARKNAVAMAKGKMTYEEATKSLGLMGRASKAAAIGLKALSIAGNMIVSFVIFKGIELIASAIDNYANRVKYAQERLDEFSNTVSVISDYANLEEIAKDKKYIISHQNERVILTEEYTKIYNEICQLK